MNDALLTKIDELIAATQTASLPFEQRWLDAKGVGALLCQEPGYVLKRLAPLPDFPTPMRIGQPRWKAADIAAWAEAQVERKSKPGRKRLAA